MCTPKVIYLLQLLLVSMIFWRCNGQTNERIHFTNREVAIDGYDPVAYFISSQPLKGDSAISHIFNSLCYYFVTAENRILFEKNPEQYIPKFGGWCAFSIAKRSKKVIPDPNIWKIENGDLIFFSDPAITLVTGSLMDLWDKDPKFFFEKARGNWNKINKKDEKN